MCRYIEDWSEEANEMEKYRPLEQTAGPSTAPLAMRLRESPLRMTISTQSIT
jgi:hypothetical protein